MKASVRQSGNLKKSGQMRMFACLLAPALPLQAILRSEPDIYGKPLASVTGEGTGARINFVAGPARELGVRAGMTASQARSLAPGVIIKRPADGVVRATHQALVDLALAFSHSVEDTGPDVVMMEVTGHEHIHGSFELMGAAVAAAADRNGLKVRIGFAAGARLAEIAARSGNGVTVFKKGGERDTIAHMDIRVLNPTPRLLTELGRLGIQRVGALAALPASGIGTRLGPDGVALHRLACGLDQSIVENPVILTDRFEECVSLDYSLDNLEPLMFLLSGAADRISRRMEMRGLCPGALHLVLNLDTSGITGQANSAGPDEAAEHSAIMAITVPASSIAQNPSTISMLLHRALGKNPPRGDVCGFSLVMEAGQRKSVQCQLFGPPILEPGKVRELIGKLTTFAGEGNVGSPDVMDSNARDPGTVIPFTPQPSVFKPGTPAEIAPVLGLRRFNPPLEAYVTMSRHRMGATHLTGAQAINGRQMWSAARTETNVPDGYMAGSDPVPSEIRSSVISGHIIRAAGPWYADADWWTAAPQAGAFYDVELSGRGLFRLWHDLLTDKWFVEGIWD
jgi:protein ImuB